MVFPPQLQERINDLFTRAKLVKKQDGPGSIMGYSNVLVLGQAGTGKRMFGQLFANKVGMDFAPVAAGELVQGDKGVERIKELVAMSHRSGRGTLVYIQGLDLLSDETNAQVAPVLNYLRALTRQKSKSFMIMASMSSPCKAVDGMFSDHLCMPMPNEETRKNLIQNYVKKYIFNRKINKNLPEFADRAQQVLTPQIIDGIVRDTHGLSHAQIAHVVQEIRVKASRSKDKLLTLDHIQSAVAQGVEARRLFDADKKPS